MSDIPSQACTKTDAPMGEFSSPQSALVMPLLGPWHILCTVEFVDMETYAAPISFLSAGGVIAGECPTPEIFPK